MAPLTGAIPAVANLIANAASYRPGKKLLSAELVIREIPGE
jgi:hypothetical protein